MSIKQLIFRYLPDVLYCKEANYVKQQWYCYHWVEKHLKWAYHSVNSEKFQNSNVKKDISIFMYWKQGWDNAPELVKKCLASVKRNANGHPIILLDENNVSDYIHMPFYINKYHKEGIIKEALFSDMLRICLLSEYGGYWIDATCYLSSPFPKHIEESSFFMFSNTLLPEWSSPIKGSNWYIYSRQGNPLLEAVSNFLFNYWKHETTLINYYIFHISLAAIVDHNGKFQEMWENKPYICNMNPHVLQLSFRQAFNKENYDFMLNQCFIHKLTYKYDKELLNSEVENNLIHFLNS